MIPGGSLSEKADLLKAWGFDGISIFLNEVLQLQDKTGIEVCEFPSLTVRS
jgi:hypothetical protein